jgi:phage gp16-like protein
MGALAKSRFATDPHRRAMLAKVHIAPKQLGMDEDSYRAVLRRVTGQISSADCNLVQLEALVAEFARMGFSAKAAARPVGNAATRRQPRADHPVARKARAMWISLGLLCAIRNPAEAALEAFARRQLQCETFQWANQGEADRMIEALKQIAMRHGWEQSLAGLARVHHLRALKARLCDAILAKLKRGGLVPQGWHLGKAAWELCGIADPDQHSFETEEFDRIAAALGRVLRDRGGEAAFDEVPA